MCEAEKFREQEVTKSILVQTETVEVARCPVDFDVTRGCTVTVAGGSKPAAEVAAITAVDTVSEP